jgi:hypothetical protein
MELICVLNIGRFIHSITIIYIAEGVLIKKISLK